MHMPNDTTLNATSSCPNRRGRYVGDSLLITINDEFVTVKATKIPAETKSSRSSNGTKVAMSVIKLPAAIVPFFMLPPASTSQNIGGSNSSLASAYCNRGCNITDINTTTGKVHISPAAVS
mmetsp:Transcript_32051/g.70449  ORF Transcript_32051/g.70449 Transcript_32051/m.70449 type:complete len:121 (+) Transcript_32051:966-1328(+)